MANKKNTAKPMCPNCKTLGIEHIISEPSQEESKGGDAWFNVAYCDSCGHVYGVFAKTVNPPTMKLPEINIPMPDFPMR